MLYEVITAICRECFKSVILDMIYNNPFVLRAYPYVTIFVFPKTIYWCKTILFKKNVLVEIYKLKCS